MRTRIATTVAVLLTVTVLGVDLAAQGPQGGRGGGRGRGGGFALAPLLMETDAFPDGGIVPQKFAGRGGIQPGFTFSNAPEGTVSYAIIFHDLDVALKNSPEDVLHWMVWNVPASAKGIPEGKLPDGAVQNRNYFGPGAPAGPRYHHYVFELYALNANLELTPMATREDLLAAMQGKVVAKAAYVGRYRTEAQ
jgi:hypothetical protein